MELLSPRGARHRFGEAGNKLDLLERDAKDAAEVFRRYLERERVKSRSAFGDARKDYESAARSRQARDAIPQAWNELVSGPDDLLIDLVAEKVVGLIGFRPSDEHVEDFLVQLKAKVADQVPGLFNALYLSAGLRRDFSLFRRESV